MPPCYDGRKPSIIDDQCWEAELGALAVRNLTLWAVRFEASCQEEFKLQKPRLPRTELNGCLWWELSKPEYQYGGL